MKIARRSVDRFNKDKQTPLHLAVKLNFLPGVQALLAAGADVNFVDKTGCTSLHLAVKHQLPECLKMLVSGSRVEADFNTRNFEGLTPLHTAVELKNMELMTYILEQRADINMMDGKSGRTSLFHAAENNQEDVVGFLLNKGANPDVLNYAGSTAIMAAQARNYNIVTKLLSRASDWNDEDRSGSSSPASEISVFVPDTASPRVPALWKHSVPLRNAATFNMVPGTFIEAQSAGEKEVSLSSQAPKRSKFIESVHQSVHQGASKSPSTPPKVSGISIQDRGVKAAVSTSPAKISQSKTVTSEALSSTSEVRPHSAETVSRSSKTISNTSETVTSMSETLSNTSETISSRSEMTSHPAKTVSVADTVVPGKRNTEHGEDKSDSVSKLDKNKLPSSERPPFSEFNPLVDLRAINDLARSNPLIFQKLLELKQKERVVALKSSAGVEKEDANSVKKPESERASPRLDPNTRPPGSGSPGLPVQRPQSSNSPGSAQQRPQSSNSPGLAQPRPQSSKSPVVSNASGTSHPGTSPSTVTTQQTTNPLIPSTVMSRPQSSSPRVVPATSRVIGKVSHVIEKLPQQPERIISTGMVVEHPEYGLVFRPFGPGQIQRLNQHGPVAPMPANLEGKTVEMPAPEAAKSTEIVEKLDKGNPDQTETKTDTDVSTKVAEISEQKETETDERKITFNSSKVSIPAVHEAVSSHPVTERLLNSKPKTVTIPKSRPTDSGLKSQESVPKPETNSTMVRSIANSAIAAKLRQRVLNSPHVDTAAKANANPPVHTTVTTKSSGAVLTAPERVPKLPQFGNRPTNMPPNSTPTVNPDPIFKHPGGVSKIIEHLSKPIETNRLVLDLTKPKPEKTKKSEKRKKRETNGNKAEMKKKKSILLNKDDKKDEREESLNQEPSGT